MQLWATKDDLTLTVPLAQPIEKAVHAKVRLALLNPEDVVRAQLSEDVELLRRQKQLVIRLATPFDKVPAQEMEMLHWLRVKYEVTTSNGEILVSGMEALRGATTDPFVLTAAASRVASPGLPYRVQVHVKSNNAQPLTGVQVTGDLVWDGDGAKEGRIITKAAVFSFRFWSRFGMSAETAPSLLYDYYNPESSVTLKPSHFVVTQSQQD